MVEMRWLDKPNYSGIEVPKVLQYRQMIDTTIRAGGAGTWDSASLERTANYQWSEWKDVPTAYGE